MVIEKTNQTSLITEMKLLVSREAAGLGRHYSPCPNIEINLDGYFAENCRFPAEGVDPDWAQQVAAFKGSIFLKTRNFNIQEGLINWYMVLMQS